MDIATIATAALMLMLIGALAYVWHILRANQADRPLTRTELDELHRANGSYIEMDMRRRGTWRDE